MIFMPQEKRVRENHGYKTPKQALEIDSKARCGVLKPSASRDWIIRLTLQTSLRSFSESLTTTYPFRCTYSDPMVPL
jgi:hypothetical protein